MLGNWVSSQWTPGGLGDLLDSRKLLANLCLFGGSWIIKKILCVCVFPLGVTLYHIIYLLLNEVILMKPHPLFRKRGGFLISEFSCPTLSLA